MWHNNVKSGNIEISWKPNNTCCNFCGVPVIENHCIPLTIKLFLPLRELKLLLVNTCIFKNHQRWYPSGFDRRTPRINIFIQLLDVNVCLLSEKVCCDHVRLWQSLPLHPLQHFYKVCFQLLVFLRHHDCRIPLSLLYFFDKGHTEILTWRFLKIFLVNLNGWHIITWIFVGS